MLWTVVIPAKALPEAKSRLAAASVDAAAHRRLVRAIRADTIVAASAAASVARVLLVVDRADVASPSELPVLVQTGVGLNAAVRDGAAHAARLWPADGVAALVGDLPALRPAEIADALALAARHGTVFVADAEGSGTTMLAAAPGFTLDPAFGAGSAARHERVALRIPAGAGLRHDIDTAADLAAATVLGLGRETTAVLAPTEDSLCSPGNGSMGS